LEAPGPPSNTVQGKCLVLKVGTVTAYSAKYSLLVPYKILEVGTVTAYSAKYSLLVPYKILELFQY